MSRACSACTHPDRDALDLALVKGEPKRQIAARLGLAKSAIGRHARAHLLRALVTAEDARVAASGDRLLGELVELQGKLLGLLARAEADGDVRGAIVALKEVRECIALRARLAAELHEAEQRGSARATLVEPTTIRVEYADPRDSLDAKLDSLAARLGPGAR